MARGERLNSKLAMETKVSPGFGSFIACHHVCSVLAVLCAMSAAVLWYFGFSETEQTDQWPWVTRLSSIVPSWTSPNNAPTLKDQLTDWIYDTGKAASDTFPSFKETFIEETNSISQRSISTFLISSVWSLVLIGGGIFVCYFCCKSSKTSTVANERGQSSREIQKNVSCSQLSQSGIHYDDHYVWCSRLRTVIFILILLALAISLPWEFIRLYQHEISKKAAITIAGAPVECYPHQMSVWQTLTSWLRWHFSWSEDPCEKYHKAVLVDPLWEVSPMMVLSSALTRWITQPLETFFGGLGLAFKALFSSIPSPWQPIVMVVISIIVIIVIIMSCGYQISVPFFLHIKPHKENRETIVLPHDSYTIMKRRGKSQSAIGNGN